VEVASAGPYANHCTSLRTDNHASTSSIFTSQMLFLTSNEQCQNKGEINGTYYSNRWPKVAAYG